MHRAKGDRFVRANELPVRQWVKSRKSHCVLQGVQGSILSDVNFFFFSFFSHVSLKMLVYILLQALRFI